MKKKQTLILFIGTSLFLLLGIVGLKFHNRIYAWTLGDVKSLYVGKDGSQGEHIENTRIWGIIGI